LERILTRSGALSATEARRIQAQAMVVRLSGVSHRLTQAGYPGNPGAVEALFSNARDVAAHRSIGDRNVLQLRLARARKLRERVCAAEARQGMKGSDGRSQGTGEQTNDAGNGQTERGIPNLSTGARLALIPTILMSVVGASHAAKSSISGSLPCCSIGPNAGFRRS